MASKETAVVFCVRSVGSLIPGLSPAEGIYQPPQADKDLLAFSFCVEQKKIIVDTSF